MKNEWAYKVGYMSSVIESYHGLVWKEIPGTIISRNSRRYGQSFGAIILIPGMVAADDLPRYSQPDTLGLLSYVYPNPIIHVQGLPDEMPDVEIIWKFSKIGPVKGVQSRKGRTELRLDRVLRRNTC